jgi:CheY-like chemotaxis protein
MSLPREFTEHPQHILLVDDDADSASALSRLLEGVGHAVRVAATGAEALATAASQPLDLVLCDVGLPDADGFDLMRQLRQQYDLPCIAITGHVLDDEPRLFVKYLMKPVDFEQLRRAIEEVT